jgi:hypothetical protein
MSPRIIQALQKAYIKHMMEIYNSTPITITCDDEFKEFIDSSILNGDKGANITAMEMLLLFNEMKFFVNIIAGGDFGTEDISFKAISKWIILSSIHHISYEMFMNALAE